jgi:pSer/pThr/pTyr-binding forkhead associated (FHA) protein
MEITPVGDRSGALAAFGIQAGPRVGDEVPVRLPVVQIGRGAQNEIVIDDDSVSASHARLEFDSGGWRLTDLRSTNGTFVESVRLAPEVPTPLRYGSTVRFGGVRLHFRPVEEADPDTARADYAPPPPRQRLAEERTGFRLPVWVVILLLLLIVLAIFFFGWVWVEPTPIPPTPTTGLLRPAAPVPAAPPGGPWA